MVSKILSLILSVCMLITSAPVKPMVDSIAEMIESVSQKIADSVDGVVESLGQEDKDTSATTNQQEEEFVVTEQEETVSNWDGSTAAPMTGNPVSGKTYTIDTAAELAWLAKQVNAGTNETTNHMKNITYKLTVDIDLTGYNWTPIGSGAADNLYFEEYMGLNLPDLRSNFMLMMELLQLSALKNFEFCLKFKNKNIE